MTHLLYYYQVFFFFILFLFFFLSLALLAAIIRTFPFIIVDISVDEVVVLLAHWYQVDGPTRGCRYQPDWSSSARVKVDILY